MLHSLTSTNSSSKRVGRGGKRGKTAGRGHKGQKAHGGHGIRPEMRDLIKKIPKLRGHGKNRGRTVVPRTPMFVVNLATLDTLFENGATVSPDTLIEKKVLTRREATKRGVKVLAHGDIATKIAVTGCVVSTTAKEKIEKAGGSVVA